MKLKKCTKCGQIKPASEFNRRTTGKDGLQSYCRDCQRGYNIEHEPIVQERILEIDAKFNKLVLPNGVVCYRRKEDTTK